MHEIPCNFTGPSKAILCKKVKQQQNDLLSAFVVSVLLIRTLFFSVFCISEATNIYLPAKKSIYIHIYLIKEVYFQLAQPVVHLISNRPQDFGTLLFFKSRFQIKPLKDIPVSIKTPKEHHRAN